MTEDSPVLEAEPVKETVENVEAGSVNGTIEGEEVSQISSQSTTEQGDPHPGPQSGSAHRSGPASTKASESSLDLSRPTLEWLAQALETISTSKEARKNKALAEAVQLALKELKESSSPSPEVLFEP